MLIAAGYILFALGALCGAWLVLSPFGFVGGAPGFALWVLFPAFTIVGYLLAAAPSRDSSLPVLSRVTGAILLLLALAAAIGLVLQAMGVVTPASDTMSLWYVLAIGLVLGAAGLASHRGERTPGVRA